MRSLGVLPTPEPAPETKSVGVEGCTPPELFAPDHDPDEYHTSLVVQVGELESAIVQLKRENGELRARVDAFGRAVEVLGRLR